MKHTDSPTLVLIHGAGATHAVWDSVVDELHGLTVLAPDLPGHVADNGASLATVAGYADAVQEELPDGPVVLVGHSLGGHIACELAARDLNIAGIIAIGTGALLAVNEDLLTTAKEQPAHAMVLIRRWSLRRNASDDKRDQLEASASHESVMAVSDGLIACNTYVDAPTRLSEFAGQTLVVIGDQDRMVPRDQAEKLAAASPSAQLIIVEDAGHTPQITQPSVLASLITDFVASL